MELLIYLLQSLAVFVPAAIVVNKGIQWTFASKEGQQFRSLGRQILRDVGWLTFFQALGISWVLFIAFAFGAFAPEALGTRPLWWELRAWAIDGLCVQLLWPSFVRRISQCGRGIVEGLKLRKRASRE